MNHKKELLRGPMAYGSTLSPKCSRYESSWVVQALRFEARSLRSCLLWDCLRLEPLAHSIP